MKLAEYEQIVPHVQAAGLTWVTPNRHCAWRIETLLTKEPDTIEWIGKMELGKVFFDIGANIGQYSLLAANRGVHVHAIEPESQNFALLCRNIAINKLSGKVVPWPVAISDRSGLDDFMVQQLIPGNSCNSFGESVDYHLRPKTYDFKQGCFGLALDCFCHELGFLPDYIKVDVDGLEHKVLKGGVRALHNVKSILVETNTHLLEHQEMARMLEQEFGLVADRETAEKARRKEGPFEGIGNVIFYRRESL